MTLDASYQYQRTEYMTVGGFRCVALFGPRHILVDSGYVLAVILLPCGDVYLEYLRGGDHSRTGQLIYFCR